MRIAALLVVATVAACGPSSTTGPGAGRASGGSASDHTADGAVPRPTEPMSLDEARRYVLALVNHDRAAHGLPAVTWDDTAAKAGQRQADDMAARGFTAHVGSDGSVPEVRYTESGGVGMVMENVGCFADAKSRALAKDARFTAESLERVEKAFMDEVPPNDGHKRNILTAWHTTLGVGLAATTEEPGIACMAQEFVDDYGEYASLPARTKVGAKVNVSGRIRAPATIAGVGVSRVDTPKPRKPADLLKTHSYAIPKPFAIYFPKGFKTPIPVVVDGNGFSIDVPLSDGAKPGIYGVSVWAKHPATKDLVMISLRTIFVE